MAEHGDAHATPLKDGPDFHKNLVTEAIAITVGETDLIANTGIFVLNVSLRSDWQCISFRGLYVQVDFVRLCAVRFRFLL